ncbi:MAG: iron-containing alcohol dehydrogenase, partial [Anaerolineaceae bacterium]|nr:iron-containing alcohol dehydrogenase [Anaerolineaceae bacterium]
MNNFELFNPVKIIFGAGEVKRIGEAAKAYGKRVLIISYSKVDFYGDLFDRIHQSLTANGIGYVDCFVATANPKLSEARKAIALGKQEQADVVIGVGGGSAMDLAKVVAAGILYPHDLSRMIKFSHSTDEQIPPKAALPLV